MGLAVVSRSDVEALSDLIERLRRVYVVLLDATEHGHDIPHAREVMRGLIGVRNATREFEAGCHHIGVITKTK